MATVENYMLVPQSIKHRTTTQFLFWVHAQELKAQVQTDISHIITHKSQKVEAINIPISG
jgi:hypothetical protein